MPGQLFTQYFLTDGIRRTAAWHKSVTGQDAFDAYRTALSDLLNKVAAYQNPNEAATEQDLIRPLFRLLGWNEYLPSRAAIATRTSPTICSSSTPTPSPAPPPPNSPPNATPTPSPSPKANASACPSTHATTTIAPRQLAPCPAPALSRHRRHQL